MSIQDALLNKMAAKRITRSGLATECASRNVCSRSHVLNWFAGFNGVSLGMYERILGVFDTMPKGAKR